MRDKDYAAYAPDKHTPAARRQRVESAAFIEALRVKHGVPVGVLYPEHSARNRFRSFARAVEGER